MCPDNENKPLNGLRSDAITYVGQPNKDLYRESGCISFLCVVFALSFLLFLSGDQRMMRRDEDARMIGEAMRGNEMTLMRR